MNTPSFFTSLAIAALCAATLPRSAVAADVTLNDNDGAGASSWASAGHWSSGAAPVSGNDYIVSGKNLRTPQDAFLSTPFKGDSLTLDNGAYLVVKSSSGSTISANFVLHQGTIRAVDWDRGFTFGGTIAVHGTTAAPSVIEMAGLRETAIVSAVLTGDSTALLKAVVGGNGDAITFAADNSGYCGRMSFSSPNSAGSSGRLRFDGPTSAGISGDPSVGEPFLTIASTAGKPVVELNNVLMDASFTIQCDNANAQIDLLGTNALFGATLAGSSAGIPVNVLGDAMLQSASPLALSFGENGRILARVHPDGTSEGSSIAAGSTLALAGSKIPVRLDGVIPHTNATFSAVLFTIPTSVRTVTADDIDLDADDFGLMTIDVSVANGLQTVSLRAGNVVYYSVPNTAEGWGNWAAYNQAAQYWSDNRSVHNDADYLIGYDVPDGCLTLRGCAAPFAGRSLTFARDATFVPKGSASAPDAVGDLRMFPGSTVLLQDAAVAVSGGMTLAGKAGDNPVVVSAPGTRTLNLRSNLAGDGPVRFLSNAAGANFTVALSGDSTAFTGTMEFYGGNAGRRLTVSIDDEANLGGNPAAFNAAQTFFNTRIDLVVTNNVVIDDENRGITFAKPVATAEIRNPVDVINVGAGATLTLNVPMVVDANLEKTGAGTLAIGGAITGTASNLAVSAGSVMPVTRQASSAMRYTMAAGTGLALALDAADADVAADGLYVEDASHLTLSGSSLPVTIRGTIPEGGVSVKCGIINVPASMADAIATALGGSATFSNTDTGRTRAFPIERETLAGDRVRFFATIGKGPTVLYVR